MGRTRCVLNRGGMEVLLDVNIIIIIKRHLEQWVASSPITCRFARQSAVVRLFCCHPQLFGLPRHVRRCFQLEQPRCQCDSVSYGPRHMTEAPAICAAAASGDMCDVRELLAWGCCVNAVDLGGGRSPLDWACANRHADVAALLVTSAADVNHISGDLGVHGRKLTMHNTWTPLHLAAEAQSTELVGMLLRARAAVNGANSTTPTPLCIASRHRMPDAVRVLTQHGGRL